MISAHTENERTVAGMAEYISKESAISIFRAKAEMAVCTPAQTYFDRAAKMLELLPAADVAPVRHGRWLFVKASHCTSAWWCSECGRSVAITCDEELRQRKLEKEYPFCHCGAKMDGGFDNG